MKKVLSLTLALAMTLSFASCDIESENDLKSPSDVDVVGKKDSDKTSASATEVTVEKIVLVDQAGVKITAKELDSDSSFMGPELKLLIENDSGKDLTFQCKSASVNGYMADTMMSVDVANGKKANDGVTFMESGLDACGIDAIADMEIAFHIYETAEWETYLDTEPCRIETSIAETYDYTYDDSGDPAYEGNGIKIKIKGLSEDASVFGSEVTVYVENMGEKDITVQVRDISVNGFMVNGIFSCDVTAGKRAVDGIILSDTDLEENDIEVIEDIELSFHIFDDEWNTVVDTDAVKISF